MAGKYFKTSEIGPFRAAVTALIVACGLVLAPVSMAHAQEQAGDQTDAIADFQSLLALAAAHIRSGNYDAGAAVARQAFAMAQTNAQKVDAARLVASAHFRAGHYSRAEIWLRKAFNAAPDARSQAVLR